MFLWFCWFCDYDDWGCYVIAPTRGRAKALFFGNWCYVGYGEYTDVRAQKIKRADGFQEAVLDDDCKDLEALGVRYMTEKEMEY